MELGLGGMPTSEAIASSIQLALKDANVEASAVDFVCAHGVGVPKFDKVRGEEVIGGEEGEGERKREKRQGARSERRREEEWACRRDCNLYAILTGRED
eukprot:678727-Hanusia_phi.AAC.2